LYSVPAFSPTVRDGVGIYERYAEWYWRRWKEPSKTQSYFTKFHDQAFGKDFKYQDFAPMFKAEAYEPEEWAKLFERAGAKYVVLTSKHHEGFTLWPSKYSWNWNAMDIGPHRDLLGDLTKAVKGKDLFLINTKFSTNDIEVSVVQKPVKVAMLGLDIPIISSYKNGKLVIKIPNINPANIPCNYAWVFKLEGAL
jgi:hypothetical protein